MNNLFKKIPLPLLFFLLSFFLPFLSSASTSVVGPPCTPDITPAFQEGVNSTICKYCPTLSPDPQKSALHLKWDVNGTFKDPVCNIQCWGPSGDACYNFSSSKILDVNGRDRSTNLKPKDDIYLTNPPMAGTISGPGTNMQVWCSERATPSLIKKSAGIRVVSDCGGVTSCQERKFIDIFKDLDAYNTTKITEKNAAGWSKTDELDYCKDLNVCVGSGDINNLSSKIDDVSGRHVDSVSRILGLVGGNRDISALSLIKIAQQEIIWGVSDFDKVLTQNKTKALPFGMIVFSTSGEAQAVLLTGIIYDSQKQGSGAEEALLLKTVTSGGSLATRTELKCSKQDASSSIPPGLAWLVGFDTTFYSCSPDNSAYLIPILFKKGGSNPFSILMSKLESKVNANTSSKIISEDEALISNNKSAPSFVDLEMNVSIPTMGSSPFTISMNKETLGWVNLQLRTTYLSSFDSTGKDCHPDGTFSKAKNFNSNFLAQAISPLKKLLQYLGFSYI